jgi:hypothetical protein
MENCTKFAVCWNDYSKVDPNQREYFETIEDAIEFIANAPEDLQKFMVIRECY